MQKKSINFGFRGWMLVLWAATAFFAYVVIGNYPLNILADLYGGSQTLSMVYTGASVVGIAIQLILSSKAGKIKSWKLMGVIFGILSILALVAMMLIQPGTVWIIVYGLGTVLSVMYGTWALSVLVGIWFPRRKGTVMGVITFAFPIANALLGFFASGYYGKFEPLIGQAMETQMGDLVGSLIAGGTAADAAEGIASGIIAGQCTQQTTLTAFIPYLIVIIVGLIIGLIFIKDFPEQVGAYRDNDKSITPEVANQMMKFEEENRKSTVWTTGHTLASGDFWLITIPMGLLLMFAVGMMTQTNAIITPVFGDDGYTVVMMVVAAFGIIGSWLFGVIDTKFGTRTSVTISMICMVVAGILGGVGATSKVPLLIAIILVAMFMGASSNFTVSAAVQYWRIEDFPSVFSVVNPVANLLNAFGPMVIAALIASSLGASAVFYATGIAGVVGFILCLLFKPGRVKATDDKYRKAAGKPLDDALVGRK